MNTIHPDQLRGVVQAPEFPADLDWLNTPKPIQLADLRGKIVLLDFWTYCCINCHHVFPDLKRLEDEFAEELVVIGVHSAKFETEKDSDNIRDAIQRHGIRHPVVNDADFQIWSQYVVRAWPSFVLINPEGKIVGQTSGEGIYDRIQPYIKALASHFSDTIDKTPFVYTPEASFRAPSLLAYPTKLSIDPEKKLLYISDTNHHRIIVTETDGTVLDVIGSGEAGFKDGNMREAQFHRPHGVFFHKNRLYVADTDNHSIRVVDLSSGSVSTLAGTGTQARMLNQRGTGKHVALASPWDLTMANGSLWVAMAGHHQIWKIDPETGKAEPWAGTGGEDIVDGHRSSALLAQPSGIVTDGKTLYFADSEVSAVRKVDIAADGRVQTLIGHGLFQFGDRDGHATQALMQHPLDVALWNGQVIVADTYNNRIKRINPQTKEIASILGSGEEGDTDGTGLKARFDEPSGLVTHGDTLWIADTNNHLIRRANLVTGEVSTLRLRNLEKLEQSAPSGFTENAKILDGVQIAVNDANILIHFELPAGHVWSDDAPSKVVIHTPGSGSESIPIVNNSVEIPVKNQSGDVTFTVYAYFCEYENTALCLFRRQDYIIPTQPGTAAAQKLTIPIR